ncbi:unnamed protein product [Gulo gulo]|uniref:Uncharacterized protein n=1 Tax=Gulo gulo TaxID=48420 RepID=A0A9X9LI05_GULGU|nr:unnamed protein product [Gulo gulo]
MVAAVALPHPPSPTQSLRTWNLSLGVCQHSGPHSSLSPIFQTRFLPSALLHRDSGDIAERRDGRKGGKKIDALTTYLSIHEGVGMCS